MKKIEEIAGILPFIIDIKKKRLVCGQRISTTD